MLNLSRMFLLLPLPFFTYASEPPQFFVGAKGGYQWASDDAYQDSEPNGLMLGIYSGLQLTPTWSWDVGYQYHDELKSDVTSINVNTWLVESALRYDLYLQNNFSIYGRLGAAYWNMEKTPASSNKLDESGFSPLGEVGVNYNFTQSVGLSVGYQYIDGIGSSETGKYDSHGVMLGVTYTFGDKAQPVLVETMPEPVQEVVIETEPEVFTFPSKIIKVTFGNDSSQLSASSIEPLSEVATVLNTYPQSRVVIVGHADSTGSSTYNQVLSEKRAQTVVTQVIELGVSPEQVNYRGEGESCPVADNSTVEGRTENRRVEVTISQFQ